MLARALELPDTGSRPRVDRSGGQLIGSSCASCAASAWPARAICHRCGEVSSLGSAFGPAGTLLTYTRVWIARPPFEPPYLVGQVELEHGPTVFAHIRSLPDDVRVPLPVGLVIAPADDAVPLFWFEPS